MKHAYFVVLPGAHVLDLAGPLQIVATLGELGIAKVTVECIGPVDAVRSYQGALLAQVQPLPRRLRPDAAVFVIGSKLSAALTASKPWLQAVAWLRERAADDRAGLQVCGVCTGSFVLAQAGLLDGRVCTTHHRFIRQLQRQCPRAHVVENRVFVGDGRVWTSAGITSGIDLSLHLVARAYGEHAAVQVARENVVHFRRFGGDPALGAALRHRAHGNARVHAVQDAIARELARSVSCDELARDAGWSSRHLARVFAAETGVTIKRFQIELRLDLARQLLQGSTLSIERIAERCGFGSVQAFRANWDRREDRPPSALRPRRASDR